ncbi:MAG: isoprenyl transferase [Candidatus Nanopelagicales bacterium]
MRSSNRYTLPPSHHTGVAAPNIPKGKVPQHIAVVMDGNGRWAKNRGLPRTAGHEAGEAALAEMVYGALEIGVTHLSAFAFSTENWKRSPEEVKFLMNFNKDVLRRRRDEFMDLGVQVRWSGSDKRLWRSVIDELNESVAVTKRNSKLVLNMCVNYGGRDEITAAVKEIAAEVAAGELSPDRITESTISKRLYDPKLPDVDLFIRTSGEQRISNFLLWQSAYAEFVFLQKLWPDCDRLDLWRAVTVYSERDRRFGGTK